MKWIAVFCAFACSAAADPWITALRQMPLPANTVLNRDNAIPALLSAFQSNDTVKALVFLPSVADDFYLVNRDKPKLNLLVADVAAAIAAITNATDVRIAFRDSVAFLYLSRDTLEPRVHIKHAGQGAKLGAAIAPPVRWIDRHWSSIQPELRELLPLRITPTAQSEQAWHFARPNLCAWNVTRLEFVRLIALATSTTATVHRGAVQFLR